MRNRGCILKPTIEICAFCLGRVLGTFGRARNLGLPDVAVIFALALAAVLANLGLLSAVASLMMMMLFWLIFLGLLLLGGILDAVLIAALLTAEVPSNLVCLGAIMPVMMMVVLR